MIIAVIFLPERLLAIAALEGPHVLVNLLNVLLNISLLREGLVAAGVGASERPVLRVRAHVVHELRRVRHDAMAEAAKLALEQFEITRVAFEAFEDEYDEVRALRDLLPMLRDVLHVEVLASDGSDLPLVLHLREFLGQLLSELLREEVLDW